MKKNYIETLKTGALLISNFSVGAVIGNIVKAASPTPVGKISKIVTGLGASILTDVASDAVSKYVENQFNEVVESIKKIKETKKSEE